MDKKLEQYLTKRFTRIFQDRPHFGFECGSGWFRIIFNLCLNIQQHIDSMHENIERYNLWNEAYLADKLDEIPQWYQNKIASDPATLKMQSIDSLQVRASQIKEKFATLSFYYEGGDEYIQGLVSFAESMSAQTCEECAAPGKIYTNGWHKVLCVDHAREMGRLNNDMVREKMLNVGEKLRILVAGECIQAEIKELQDSENLLVVGLKEKSWSDKASPYEGKIFQVKKISHPVFSYWDAQEVK